MQIEIKVPRLGWSMDEGIFGSWLKKDGDLVKAGDAIFTLESEKAAQDIESTDAGTLQISKDGPQPGDTVQVGQVIGYLIGEKGAALGYGASLKTPSAEKPEEHDHKKALTPETSPDLPENHGASAKRQKDFASSPRARRRAAELGVEIEHLQGSGRTGRITEADVLKATANKGGVAITSSKTKTSTRAATVSQVSTMRRSIAERTAFSFSHIPHFYVRAEVDATGLVALRELLVATIEKKHGVRITLTDFLLRAQALALQKHPTVNAVWQDNGLLNYTDSDVGLVVGLPQGLVIPVIRAAQRLSFLELAKERARLVQVVREGKFTPEMLSGGATSISNLGTTRADEFAAIIAPHQSSMLAVGRAVPRPYVVGNRVEVRTTIRLSLSVDHRVLDGSLAADFLGSIGELLENPNGLVGEVLK